MVFYRKSLSKTSMKYALKQEYLQILRRLLWSQTTTPSLRNIHPMFEGGNLCLNLFGRPSKCVFFPPHGDQKIVLSKRFLHSSKQLSMVKHIKNDKKIFLILNTFDYFPKSKKRILYYMFIMLSIINGWSKM